MLILHGRNIKEIAKTPDASASDGDAENFKHFKEAVQNIQSVTEKEQEVAMATVSHDLSKNQKTKNIPKRIHFIWLGRLPERYVNNLSQILSRFPTHQAYLWTDSGNMAHHSTLLDRHQLGNRIKVKNIEKHIERPPLPGRGALSNSSWQEVRGAFHREHEGTYKNYAAASDIARLMVLYKYGGQYYDVDVFLNITNGFESLENGLLSVRPSASSTFDFDSDQFDTDEKRIFPHKEALTTENGILVFNEKEGWTDAGQGWIFRDCRDSEPSSDWQVAANCWLASLPQCGGMVHCLEEISKGYQYLPIPLPAGAYNTWGTKRTDGEERLKGTLRLTGPVFLNLELRGVDSPNTTKIPTDVEDFIVKHDDGKVSDPIEAQWRNVNAKNSKASESPF